MFRTTRAGRLDAHRLLVFAAVALALAAVAATRSTAASTRAAAAGYAVTNLVSDGSVPAQHTDPNLVNGWGIAAGPSTPWWVSDNGTDTATLYGGDGSIVPLIVQV